MDLTSQDIQDLLDALDCWESDISKGAFMTDMLGAVLVPKDQREKFRQEQSVARDRDNAKQRERKDRCIMLKAKIVGIRQRIESRDAERIIAESKQ